MLGVKLPRQPGFHEPWTTLLKQVDGCESEKDLENKVILPLLELLGYEPGDFAQQAPLGKKRVDFLVTAQKAPPYCHYLIIEAKAPNSPITHKSWQLRQYLHDSGSVLGLLTNGNQFQLFYNDGTTVHALWEFKRAQLYQNYRLLGSLLLRSNCDRVMAAFSDSHRRVHDQVISAIAKLSRDPQLLDRILPTPLTIPNSQSQKAMIITVFNNKGGVGKTTLTINLAAALSQLGKRILLIDIDAQANLTTGLGIDPLEDVEKPGRKDITHLLTEPKLTINDVIMKKKWSNVSLDVVPAHIRLSGMENQLVQLVDSDRILAKKLKTHDYDFIFIDPPPSFGKVNRIALMASAGVLVPTQLSPYPIRALEFVLGQVEEVSQFRETPLPILGIAVSMHDRQSRAFNLSMVEELYERLRKLPGGSEVAMFSESSWIPRLNVVSKSQDQGLPLSGLDSISASENLIASDKTSLENSLQAFDVLAQELLQKVEKKHQ